MVRLHCGAAKLSDPAITFSTVSRSVLQVSAGALLVALGAQIDIPAVPVSFTLQSLAICVLGLVLGPRLAAMALALYLAMVLANLPVLSSAQQYGGRAFFGFLAAGYVVGFIPGAAVAGWLGRRRGFSRMIVAGLACHAVILMCGVVVLAMWSGITDALANGLYPFLAGAVIKSLVAAGMVAAWRHLWPPRETST